MSGSAFADTNVLIYYVGVKTEKRQRAAQALAAQPEVVISAQVVSEFVNVCLRKQVLTPSETRKAAFRLVETFRLVPIGEAMLRRGLALHERYGFQWWDALIVAAALEGGCSTLYSEDMQHGQQVEGLRVVNPFSVAS